MFINTFSYKTQILTTLYRTKIYSLIATIEPATVSPLKLAPFTAGAGALVGGIVIEDGELTEDSTTTRGELRVAGNEEVFIC